MIRNKKGQVLVLVALAIFALLGLAALGIDVGYMYSIRNELQRSADAGALAGASSFQTGDWNDTNMALDHPRGLADNLARTYASKDIVVTTLLNPAEPSNGGEVHVDFPKHDQILVVTYRDAPLFFARIFGMSNRLIWARAVAEAKPVGPQIPIGCIKPWAIPYPWNDLPGVDRHGNPTEPNGLYDNTEHVYTTCEDNVARTGLCPGALLTVKIGTPNDNTSSSGQQSSGQFFIIQGNLGGTNWYTGGAEYREYNRSMCFDVDVDLPIDLMTGDKVGPTQQGVNDLINDPIMGDPGARWDEALGRPKGGLFDNNWIASPRVVRVVIYDPSRPLLGSVDGHGTHTYINTPYDLAGFWLEDITPGAQGTIKGRYIPADVIGAADETTGPLTGTEPKVISLVE